MSGRLRRGQKVLALLAAFSLADVARADRSGPLGQLGERARSSPEVEGEWQCRLWHGAGGPRGARQLRMILDTDGSWLLQGMGPQSAAYLVLGTWFRAPKGQIYASGRVTRWGSGGGLGPLFALELFARDGRLVSDEDPRAECRRP